MADQLERSRLRRIALEQACALQVREVGMDGRRRSKADRLADLADGRRVAVAIRVLDEKLPDLLLPGRQHAASEGGFPYTCSLSRVRLLPDGVKKSGVASALPEQQRATPTHRP